MSLVARIVVSLVLFGVVVGMGVHHGSAEEEHWTYPGSDELGTDYDRYVGQKTLLFAGIESVDAEERTARVRVGYAGGTFHLRVTGFDSSVEPGGRVQLFGTIEDGHVLSAERVVVVNESGGAEGYKYAASALGALVVLVAFFRRWRVDWDAVAFEVR